jgi:peptidoglycan/LPS O-acetylase OafA/YrhL
MLQVATYAIAFGIFAGIFTFLKQHPNWSRGEDGQPFSAPGWWRPLAVGWFAVLVLFVLYASLKHGFRWGMLLVFPILGGAFALGVILLSFGARQVGDR